MITKLWNCFSQFFHFMDLLYSTWMHPIDATCTFTSPVHDSIFSISPYPSCVHLINSNSPCFSHTYNQSSEPLLISRVHAPWTMNTLSIILYLSCMCIHPILSISALLLRACIPFSPALLISHVHAPHPLHLSLSLPCMHFTLSSSPYLSKACTPSSSPIFISLVHAPRRLHLPLSLTYMHAIFSTFPYLSRACISSSPPFLFLVGMQLNHFLCFPCMHSAHSSLHISLLLTWRELCICGWS